MNIQHEPNSLLGVCLTWVFYGIHQSLNNILSTISLTLAIIVSIDTLTGSHLKGFLQKMFKK